MKNITIQTRREGSDIIILITEYDTKMRREETKAIKLTKEQALELARGLSE